MLTIKEKIYAKFIGNLHTWQRDTARIIIKPKPTEITKTELKDILNTAKVPIDKLYLADRKYYIDTWDKWQKAIEIDWTNTNKYIKDAFDCDNFADSFASRMAEYYGWNTAGKISITLYVPDTTNLIGYHRANLIVAKEGNDFKVFGYDPLEGMGDRWTDKILQGQFQLKNWLFDLSGRIEFN